MVPDEESLLSQARRGDLAAFNQLVERLQGLVYNVCRQTLGEADAAADATQEAFFAAYRGLAGFRGGSFRGWVLRIATNHCLDVLRARRRHREEPLPDIYEAMADQPSPEQRALTAEVIGVVEAALAKLPPDQRLCVVLVDVQGLDYQEAAAALHLNLGTLKSRLSRARAQLRELIPPEFRPMNEG
ncbi:MAG TPA: RNA polymerase sigma factor [Chloroflexota bacterium]|nr:RNA polymerase sigma factor [Chloroflexota bacterium]